MSQDTRHRDWAVISLVSASFKFVSSRISCRACLAAMSTTETWFSHLNGNFFPRYPSAALDHRNNRYRMRTPIFSQ